MGSISNPDYQINSHSVWSASDLVLVFCTATEIIIYSVQSVVVCLDLFSFGSFAGFRQQLWHTYITRGIEVTKTNTLSHIARRRLPYHFNNHCKSCFISCRFYVLLHKTYSWKYYIYIFCENKTQMHIWADKFRNCPHALILTCLP